MQHITLILNCTNPKEDDLKTPEVTISVDEVRLNFGNMNGHIALFQVALTKEQAQHLKAQLP